MNSIYIIYMCLCVTYTVTLPSWQGGLTISWSPSQVTILLEWTFSQEVCSGSSFQLLVFRPLQKTAYRTVVGTEVLELHSYSYYWCFHRSSSKTALKAERECGYFLFCQGGLHTKRIKFIQSDKEIIASVTYLIKLLFCVNNFKFINAVTLSGYHICLMDILSCHTEAC